MVINFKFMTVFFFRLLAIGYNISCQTWCIDIPFFVHSAVKMFLFPYEYIMKQKNLFLKFNYFHHD